MVILQKIGRAAPSVVATLIERLPAEDDSQRPMEENIAQDVAAMAYVGRSCGRVNTSIMPLTVLCPSNASISRC
jgi:hypothetical protein